MTDSTMRRGWLYAGVACVTGATLILELALTRIFSVIMYYHFSFLAISMALFGLGLAGVVVYLRPALMAPARFRELLRRYSLYAAGATVIALLVVLRQHVGLGLAARNLATVSLIYLVCALPFLFAGMTVTLAVGHLQRDMGRLYFADLFGAAAGCLAVVPMLELLGGPSTVLLVAALFVCGHLLFSRGGQPRAVLRLGPGALLLAGAVALVAVNTARPLFKMPSAKETREERVLFSRWNSFSRVTVEQTPEDFLWLRIDSSAATRIFAGRLEQQGWQPTGRYSETRWRASSTPSAGRARRSSSARAVAPTSSQRCAPADATSPPWRSTRSSPAR